MAKVKQKAFALDEVIAIVQDSDSEEELPSESDWSEESEIEEDIEV